MNINLKVQLTNRNGEPFLGPGPVALLKAVEACGSIHRAAVSMNMSYVKALRLVSGVEENLPCKVVVSQIGGRGGGGSVLTPFGRKLIESYDAFLSKITRYSAREFGRSLAIRIKGRERNV